jgi:NAD-dependent DNA ligase
MDNIKSIVAQLEIWDDEYTNGIPSVSDVQYDQLKIRAQKMQPNHSYFMKVGSDVRGGKIKLPYTMGSLTQIYEGDATGWVAKYDLKTKKVIISHKLDGVSCMLQYKNGQFQIAYSRGNGYEGADYSRHVKKLKSVPQTITGTGHLTIRGELIMAVEKFEKNWAGDYANPRNMVAGAMNRSTTTDAVLNDIVFIAYQTVDGSDEYLTASQKEDLALLKSLGFTVVEHDEISGSDVSDPTLTKALRDARVVSNYELDGIVVTINEKNSQKTLSSSSSLNPEHSVKYKVQDASATKETKVVKVHYEVSKWGREKPRVEIVPVKLGGVKVTYATGFNGRFIVDNQIGPGKTIKLVRSGEVIPYITDVIPDDKITAQYPDSDWEWDQYNEIDFVRKNYQTDPDVIFKQVLDFFETLEVDLLKESSMAKVFDAFKLRNRSYEEAIDTILNLMELEWEGVIGSNGSKIFTSLERRLAGLTLPTYLGAVMYFGSGFGVRKSKLLIKNLANESDVWNLKLSDVIDFDGFELKTATSFVNGLNKAKELKDRLGLNFIVEVKTDEFKGMNIVFTGFRDKDLQSKLEKAGAKVGSSVSKNTTHLVTAEPNSTSGKAVKARELGIKTLSVDEFKDEFNV